MNTWTEGTSGATVAAALWEGECRTEAQAVLSRAPRPEHTDSGSPDIPTLTYELISDPNSVLQLWCRDDDTVDERH